MIQNSQRGSVASWTHLRKSFEFSALLFVHVCWISVGSKQLISHTRPWEANIDRIDLIKSAEYVDVMINDNI